MNLNMIETLQKQLIRGGLKYVSEGHILGERDWPLYSRKRFAKPASSGSHASVMLARTGLDYPGSEP